MSCKGHDHRLDLPLLRADGRGVDQGGDAPPIRRLQDDLLGPHRLPGAQPLGQGELLQGDLPPIGAPEGQHLQKLLRRGANLRQRRQDAVRRVGNYRRRSGKIDRFQAAVSEWLSLLNTTQTELAELCGLSPGYFSLLMAGKRSPSPDTRRRIQEALGVSEFDRLFIIETAG